MSYPLCFGVSEPLPIQQLKKHLFSLVHGAEAVLPVEITHEAPKIVTYDESTSNEALQDDVDALDKARDIALARAMQYQQNLRNYHSTRVCPRSFEVGDLMLRLK
jgi:hypothetical protein